jgi:hypothetical protein
MQEDITSGVVAQVKKENRIRAESLPSSRKIARQSMPETSRADQWLQVLVDVLTEGNEYGIPAEPVNYQNDSALIRLPGLRVCSGSGSGSHLVFWHDMLPDGKQCLKCGQKVLTPTTESDKM